MRRQQEIRPFQPHRMRLKGKRYDPWSDSWQLKGRISVVEFASKSKDVLTDERVKTLTRLALAAAAILNLESCSFKHLKKQP